MVKVAKGDKTPDLQEEGFGGLIRSLAQGLDDVLAGLAKESKAKGRHTDATIFKIGKMEMRQIHQGDKRKRKKN